MKKQFLVMLSLLIFSNGILACANHVNISTPHVGEEELLNSMKNQHVGGLKKMNIYQVFSGELQKRPSDIDIYKAKHKAQLSL